VALSMVFVGSSGGPSASAAIELMHAAVATTSADTASMGLTAKVTMSSAGQTLSFQLDGSGVVDMKRHIATLTAHVSGLQLPPGLEMREIISGGSIYVGGSISQGHIPAGKHWMEEGVPSTSGISSATSSSFSSPSALLTSLATDGNSVTDLGTTTSNGVSYRQYRVVMSKAGILARLNRIHVSAEIRRSVAVLFMSKSGLNYVVSVGVSDHLIHAIQYSLTFNVKSVSMTMNATETFSDFGRTVAVTVPAASDVYVIKTP